MDFSHTMYYGPDKMEEAYKKALNLTKDNIRNRSHIILGMVGYSSLKAEGPELGGASTKQYEETCDRVYSGVMDNIKTAFPNLGITSIDGASDMGIDKVLIGKRLRDGIDGLSFTCPEYIKYVQDIPNNTLFESQDADTYLENYARCADIMIVAGGRNAAYWKNHLISRYSPPFGNSISPIFDPISLITGKEDLPYYERADAFSEGMILNASRAIMEKNQIALDKTVDAATVRLSQEVIEFLSKADFLKGIKK